MAQPIIDAAGTFDDPTTSAEYILDAAGSWQGLEAAPKPDNERVSAMHFQKIWEPTAIGE